MIRMIVELKFLVLSGVPAGPWSSTLRKYRSPGDLWIYYVEELKAQHCMISMSKSKDMYIALSLW